MILRKSGLWDSVYLDHPIDRSILRSLVCTHKDEVSYTRTDYRNGPGWLSDTYKGSVCPNCGTVIKEEKVY